MCPTIFRPQRDPRLLYSVGSNPDGEPALLSAWVGCCAGPGEQRAHTGYVALEGELCAYTSSLLRDPLFDFVAYAGDVVVDLGRLRFIDSAGVGFLDELASRQSAQGGFVHLHDPQPFVQKVMRLVDAAGARRSAEPRQASASRTRQSRTCPYTVEYGNRWMIHVNPDLLRSQPNRTLDAVPFARR